MSTFKLFSIGIISAILCHKALATYNLSLDQMYKLAKENVQTPEGEKFDKEIELITRSKGSFDSNMQSCLMNTTPTNVYGVYSFTDNKGAYKVILRPKSDFSECVTKQLEGINLPSPPKAPYYSPFKINFR